MKKLELEIKSCNECPFNQYDGDYNIGYDSGWDCQHPDTEHRRIIDEGPLDGSKQQEEHEKEKDKILNSFPDWCPIPDYK